MGAGKSHATAEMDALKGLLKNAKTTIHFPALLKLVKVRPFMVSDRQLLVGCDNLDEAILVAVAAEILGIDPDVDLASDLEKIDVMNLDALCRLLIDTNGGAVIVLDDFVNLIGKNTYSKMLNQGVSQPITHVPTAKGVFDALSIVINGMLRKPGVVMAVTGRSPTRTYNTLMTEGSPIIYTTPVTLDALSPADIANILQNTQAGAGGRPEPLRDLLHLTKPEDVQQAAGIIHFYSGGNACTVKIVIDAMVNDQVLLMRGEKAVWDTLHPDYMKGIYTNYIQKKDDLLPRWSRVESTWDGDKTMRELLIVLQRNGELLDADMKVDVGAADGSKVTLLDLLSVMGMPFQVVRFDNVTKMPEKISVFPYPWVLQAMLEEESVMKKNAELYTKAKEVMEKSKKAIADNTVTWAFDKGMDGVWTTASASGASDALALSD